MLGRRHFKVTSDRFVINVNIPIWKDGSTVIFILGPRLAVGDDFWDYHRMGWSRFWWSRSARHFSDRLSKIPKNKQKQLLVFFVATKEVSRNFFPLRFAQSCKPVLLVL